MKEILQYKGLLSIFEIVRFKLIHKKHNNLFVSHFKIKKTFKQITKKYY